MKRAVFELFWILNFTAAVFSVFGQAVSTTKPVDYDLIIVLGSPASDDCKPLPLMRERVKKGVELLNKGTARKILFTGGSVTNNCAEATAMRAYALTLGVSDSAIIVEGQALNTYQNAYYSISFMQKNSLQRAAVVTSRFHLKRSSKIFSNYMVSCDLFACPSPPDLPRCKLFAWWLRENIILTGHFFLGYPKQFGLGRATPQS